MGGLVSQTMKSNGAAKKSIVLNGYRGINDKFEALPVRAITQNYLLTIQFNNKTYENISIHIKKGETIICLYEMKIQAKQSVDIDLCEWDEGEYRLDIFNSNRSCGHIWGNFFVG